MVKYRDFKGEIIVDEVEELRLKEGLKKLGTEINENEAVVELKGDLYPEYPFKRPPNQDIEITLHVYTVSTDDLKNKQYNDCKRKEYKLNITPDQFFSLFKDTEFNLKRKGFH